MLLGLCLPTARAETKPLELKWGEIQQLVIGQRVQMVLPDGATVKGEVVTVREDSLVLDVKGTSNKEAHPKGSATIPRESVKLIRLERRSGNWGRNLGTTVGAITGVFLGGWLAIEAADSGGTAVACLAGITALGAISGYYIGKDIDRKVTVIKIVP